MCSSESVRSASSIAVEAAKVASLEPSMASKIFVGKMLNVLLLLSGIVELTLLAQTEADKHMRVIAGDDSPSLVRPYNRAPALFVDS